jgi:catechol 2,3-dioxygenase-like lactoylglutathione lyase family enzyme
MNRNSPRRRFIKTLAGSAIVAPGLGAPAQPAGGISGLDHVAVPLRNTEPMLAFYRGMGLQLRETASAVSVYAGSQMINFHRPALWQDKTFTLRAPAATPPCGDFCFVWNGTADSLKAMLDRLGAKVEVGPVPRSGGQQKNGSSTYTRDPDGNLLEFIIY